MGGTLRMRAAIVACLALAACGGSGEAAKSEFNGRVEGAVDGVMRGEAWFCDGPRGAVLVVEDERRASSIAFEGPPGSIRSGAWLLDDAPQAGGFKVVPQLNGYPDPDAPRLEWTVRGGTLTLDSVGNDVAAGRYQAETVTVDVEPKDLGDGRYSRIPNKGGVLAGFFRATRRECPGP